MGNVCLNQPAASDLQFPSTQPQLGYEENPIELRSERVDSRFGGLVQVHLYDLSEAFAGINTVGLDVLGVGGIVHAGVEVFREEFSFGTSGVSVSLPRSHLQYVYRQTVHMGRTQLKRREVEALVLHLKREWRGVDYDLFTKNCTTFCDALCRELGVGRLPLWVTRVGDAVGSVPVARRLAQALVMPTPVPAPAGGRAEEGREDGLAGLTVTEPQIAPCTPRIIRYDDRQSQRVLSQIRIDEGQLQVWPGLGQMTSSSKAVSAIAFGASSCSGNDVVIASVGGA